MPVGRISCLANAPVVADPRQDRLFFPGMGHMGHWVIGAVAVVAVTTVVFAPTAHAANKYLRKAERAYADLEYDKVGSYLKKALRKAKGTEEFARIYELSAIVHVMYGREGKAKKAFVKLLKKSPDYQLPDDASPKVRTVFESAQKLVPPKAAPGEKSETEGEKAKQDEKKEEGGATDGAAATAEAPPEEPAAEGAMEPAAGSSGDGSGTASSDVSASTTDKKATAKVDRNCVRKKKKKKRKKRKKCVEVSPSSDDIVRTGDLPDGAADGDGPDASGDGMSTDSEEIDAADGDGSGMGTGDGAGDEIDNDNDATRKKSLSDKVWLSAPSARRSTPFYTSWWFWTIVGGAVAAGGATASILLLTPPPQPTTTFGPVPLQ